MLFNSGAFLVFFPVVLLVYYLTPQKFRKYWLLATSYYFYMSWNASYVLLILLSTVVTFLGALAIGGIQQSQKAATTRKRQKNWVLFGVVGVNIGILFFFKYFNFFFGKLNQAFDLFGIPLEATLINVLLPVGISFYTFQALGYTIDVYRGTIAPEKRFVNYALFVSFFPQLVAGPIERSENLLPQLDDLQGYSYDNLTTGLKRMLFGFFQKVVIADRLAAMVDVLYDNPSEYYGAQVLVVAVLFSFQIYCDFAGYSNIAIGAARCMGVRLMINFKTPYFATSIREFWSRWHISLSSWFKTYVYIPLGGSRKGVIRTYCNIMVLFAISGLWHGANTTFVIWGMLHGVYQVVERITDPAREKLGAKLRLGNQNILCRMASTVFTFGLVTFAWIFFRANTMTDLRIVLTNLFRIDCYTAPYFDLSVFGLDALEIQIALVALGVLFVISLLENTIPLAERFARLPLPIRWAVYYAGLISVTFLAYYPENSTFVYFQF